MNESLFTTQHLKELTSSSIEEVAQEFDWGNRGTELSTVETERTGENLSGLHLFREVSLPEGRTSVSGYEIHPGEEWKLAGTDGIEKKTIETIGQIGDSFIIKFAEEADPVTKTQSEWSKYFESYEKIDPQEAGYQAVNALEVFRFTQGNRGEKVHYKKFNLCPGQVWQRGSEVINIERVYQSDGGSIHILKLKETPKPLKGSREDLARIFTGFELASGPSQDEKNGEIVGARDMEAMEEAADEDISTAARVDGSQSEPEVKPQETEKNSDFILEHEGKKMILQAGMKLSGADGAGPIEFTIESIKEEGNGELTIKFQEFNRPESMAKSEWVKLMIKLFGNEYFK